MPASQPASVVWTHAHWRHADETAGLATAMVSLTIFAFSVMPSPEEKQNRTYNAMPMPIAMTRCRAKELSTQKGHLSSTWSESDRRHYALLRVR
jgi:hypothetical protein